MTLQTTVDVNLSFFQTYGFAEIMCLMNQHNLALACAAQSSAQLTHPAVLGAPDPISKRILLALFETGTPDESLQRAFTLCRRLSAELHVLRVLPALSDVNPKVPSLSGTHAVAALTRIVRAEQETKAWLANTLPDEQSARLQVRCGAFAEQVAAHAAALGADLIVMPPGEGRFGITVTGLASATGRPVLVARAATSEAAIVGATDLEDAGYPVLRKAAELAFRLKARVVAVHNVNPIPDTVSKGVASPVMRRSDEGVSEADMQRLAHLAEQVPVDADTVIGHEANTVDAILREARILDADLVVVGTRPRPRSWLNRLIGGRVAAQVVNRARRSVLVVPLDARGSTTRSS